MPIAKINQQSQQPKRRKKNYYETSLHFVVRIYYCYQINPHLSLSSGRGHRYTISMKPQLKSNQTLPIYSPNEQAEQEIKLNGIRF